MKRPVTSLCRRPGKKTACGAACPQCGNNLRPQGRSAAGSQICRAKAARTRAQKQPPADAGDCAQTAPTGKRRTSCVGWCRLAAALWVPAGAEGMPGRKNSPRRGPGAVCRLRPMGEWQAMGCLVPGRHRTGRPPGQRACPGAKTAPGGGQQLCAGCATGGTGRHWGVWCREGTALGARRGRGHARAQKQPPAGAGGCLDAGYGCYLPRAIRVIWMHRVGSTARPRIMPS